MSDRTIWVVTGSTGQYSDNVEWFVCAYEDQAAAVKHSDEAAKRAHAMFETRCEHGERLSDMCLDCKPERHYADDAATQAWMGDLDPHASAMDYTGTQYDARPVVLRTPASPQGERARALIEASDAIKATSFAERFLVAQWLRALAASSPQDNEPEVKP